MLANTESRPQPLFGERHGQPLDAGAHAAQPVKTFSCPSDTALSGQPRSDEANIGSTFTYGGPAISVGQTNYKGVCGYDWGWGTYQNTVNGTNNGLDQGDGIFFRTDYTRPLRLTNISDGTSNTFLVGEDIPALNVHCDWPFFNHATGTCSIPLNSGKVSGQPGFGNSSDWPNLYSFRSNHTNGANFCMADGSVTFITNGINQTLYQNLSTYNGGEVASLP